MNNSIIHRRIEIVLYLINYNIKELESTFIKIKKCFLVNSIKFNTPCSAVQYTVDKGFQHMSRSVTMSKDIQ